MRFVAIYAADRRAEVIDVPTIEDAYARVGLTSGQVDFGTVVVSHGNGIGIVVYEYGLVEQPPEGQAYFACNGQLYAGNAVLYAFDEGGESVDMPRTVPPIAYFPNAQAVEKSIRLGVIQRPEMAVNGEVVWRWSAEID